MWLGAIHPSWLKMALLTGAMVFVLLINSGCQQKMADQPSFKPLQACEFFPDGQAARPVVPGTIARGHLRIDAAFFTGRIDGGSAASSPAPPDEPASAASRPKTDPADANDATPVLQPADVVPPSFRDDAAFVREFPVAVSESMIQHGYNRYMIYCVVCHDPLGSGYGRIIERGYTPPPSFHIERLRNAPPGRMFAVIT